MHHPTPHNLTSFDCAGTPGPFALHVTLLNEPFTVSAAAFHPRSHLPNRLLPRQEKPRWRGSGQDVGEALANAGSRAMFPPAHDGWVGAQRNLTRAAAGWGLQRGREGRGNWGRGVNMLLAQKSRASGSKSAQAARLLCCAQKVLARFTDLQALCGEGRCL